MQSTYIFEDEVHSDFTLDFMQQIGMNADQIDSVLNHYRSRYRDQENHE